MDANPDSDWVRLFAVSDPGGDEALRGGAEGESKARKAWPQKGATWRSRYQAEDPESNGRKKAQKAQKKGISFCAFCDSLRLMLA